MAAAERFHCRVTGRGGHGAMPHQTVDAVVVASQIVTALQTVVSRNVNPAEMAVVSVGSLHAGSAFNIIAEQAELWGTIRTLRRGHASDRPAPRARDRRRDGATRWARRRNSTSKNSTVAVVNDARRRSCASSSGARRRRRHVSDTAASGSRRRTCRTFCARFRRLLLFPRRLARRTRIPASQPAL